MLDTSTGIITSPNFNAQYPDNTYCSWLISMPGKRIGLQFVDFNTQYGYDRLEIYKEFNSERRFFDWSGLNVPDGYLISPNYFYIIFTANDQNDRKYRGFKMSYEEYLYVVK